MPFFGDAFSKRLSTESGHLPAVPPCKKGKLKKREDKKIDKNEK
jgi:hypothetical protein